MMSKKLQLINWKLLLYLTPLIIIITYYFLQSLTFNLHDFSNSYFSARMIKDGISYNSLYNIYEFNNYIWSLGYEDVLVDFYLNSPFTITAFYPLSYIEDAYLAKAIFNVFSSLFFVCSIFYLVKKKFDKKYWIFLLLPILFLVPIRNQILFGQSYFLIFSLVVFGFLFIEDKNESIGGSLLSFAVLLKVFPAFYGVALLFQKNWKSIIAGFVMAIILIFVSIYITGFVLWETYFLEIIPNAIQNNSTVDFRFNAQSMDVFLKALFIQDSYYNPDAIFNNEQLFIFFRWIFKSVIIGVALRVSFINKNNLFKLASIWVVALFLLQSRTATYAQILWIIPLIYILNEKIGTTKKIGFLIVLFIICNMPISRLEGLPILFEFSRLWLTIILAILFYKSFSVRLNFKWILIVFILFTPMHLSVFTNNEKINSEYVLTKKEHFMVYDFFEKDGNLFINVLGKKGSQIVDTNISVSSFDENSCELDNNQIMLNGQTLTDNYSLKKKPVLVNNKEVYYLTDHRSRRGAFTLKKISIEKLY